MVCAWWLVVGIVDHGDHVVITKSRMNNAGGVIMLGRSDGVLYVLSRHFFSLPPFVSIPRTILDVSPDVAFRNPGGVRFGSAEIYEVLEVEFGASPATIAAAPPSTATTNGPATTAVTSTTGSSTPHLPLAKKHTISDCLVVGQAIKDSNGATVDERVVLFVKMPEGEVVSEEFVKAVNGEIRRKRTARHVPAEVSHTYKRQHSMQWDREMVFW